MSRARFIANTTVLLNEDMGKDVRLSLELGSSKVSKLEAETVASTSSLRENSVAPKQSSVFQRADSTLASTKETPSIDLLVMAATEILHPTLIWDLTPQLLLILSQLELYQQYTSQLALRYTNKVEATLTKYDRKNYDLSHLDDTIVKLNRSLEEGKALRMEYLPKVFYVKKRVRSQSFHGLIGRPYNPQSTF